MIKKLFLLIIIIFLIYFIDIPTSIYIKNNVNGIVKTFFEKITIVGSFRFLFLTNLLLLLFYIYKFYKEDKQKIIQILKIALLQSISAIFIQILKFIFGRTRPLFYIAGEKSFNFFEVGFDSVSFPSGHSAGIWCFIFCIIYLYNDFFNKNKKSKYFLYLFGFFISISRVIINVHYISDIFIGFLISFYFVNIIFNKSYNFGKKIN